MCGARCGRRAPGRTLSFHAMSGVLDRLRAALVERYDIEREIGRGGMATVYVAQDLKHHRSVAVQVLHPHLADNLGPERFLREIQIAASLQHPHILPLYDSGQAGGLLYYVMPYVEGESLRRRLEREKQLPLDDALEVARAVAAALDYAHRHHVVHRDIKPENVMLHEGEAMVTDFGIAKAVSAAAADTLTQTGTAMGTPMYMSPEQAAGEAELDGRSDVYSLGCMLYEMLAGKPPFTGPTAQVIMARSFTEAVAPLRTLRDTIPEAVERAALKALAKVPADRFSTAAQFAQALVVPVGATAAGVTTAGHPAASAKSIAVLPFVNMSAEAKRAIEKVPTADVQAYDYYLRGRQFFHQFRHTGIQYARRMFERAIEIDPRYALAHAGVADCCSFLYMYWDASKANLEQADAASRKAFELDPELAEAHAARGLAVSLSKRYDEAQREFETAIRLNPNLFEALYFYGRTCFQQGKLVEAVQHFVQASRVRPEDYQSALLISLPLKGLGRQAEAQAALRHGLQVVERHLELNPDDARALYMGAIAMIQLGQGERGLEWASRALAMDPEDSGVLYNVACAYALQRQTEQAIGVLEKAIQNGFGHKEWLENDSDLDSLRGHPRFQALIARL